MTLQSTPLTRSQALEVLTAAGQPFELQAVTVAGRELKWFCQSPSSLRALYCEARSEATFIVYGQERLNYQQGWERASAIGAALVERYAIAPGDRVAISMRNYPEWMLAYMAITSIGAVAVAMNALWQPDEMVYALHDSGAKLLFADSERLTRLQRCVNFQSFPVVLVRGEAGNTNVTLWQTLESDFAGHAMPDRAIATRRSSDEIGIGVFIRQLDLSSYMKYNLLRSVYRAGVVLFCVCRRSSGFGE